MAAQAASSSHDDVAPYGGRRCARRGAAFARHEGTVTSCPPPRRGRVQRRRQRRARRRRRPAAPPPPAAARPRASCPGLRLAPALHSGHPPPPRRPSDTPSSARSPRPAHVQEERAVRRSGGAAHGRDECHARGSEQRPEGGRTDGSPASSLATTACMPRSMLTRVRGVPDGRVQSRQLIAVRGHGDSVPRDGGAHAPHLSSGVSTALLVGYCVQAQQGEGGSGRPCRARSCRSRRGCDARRCRGLPGPGAGRRTRCTAQSAGCRPCR